MTDRQGQFGRQRLLCRRGVVEGRFRELESWQARSQSYLPLTKAVAGESNEVCAVERHVRSRKCGQE